MPIVFDERIREAFRQFDIKDDPVMFDVDLERCDFCYKTSDDKLVHMRSLGSGHQSIFNMLVGTI